MQENKRGHIEKTGLKEIGWFIGLWVLGVGAVLIVGGLIKLMI
jgi:hypothetical protein